MNRHPVFFAFLLLIVIFILFAVLVYGIGTLSGKRQTFSANERVGVVAVEGVITDAKEIIKQLNEFSKDESIRAVVLRIDSPGGGVAPAEEIYGAVCELKKKKQVIASMGSIAASGGYLIACGANKIVANPGTITGSISAVMHFPNFEGLMKKAGVYSSVIKSGKFKDIGSPTREMTQEEKDILQSLVDDIYDHLLDVIAKDRKIKKEDLQKFADGRVFTGRQAQKLGLVDELGDMEYSLLQAGKLAGIKGRPDAVYPIKKKTTFWEYILQGMVSAMLKEMKGPDSGFMGLYSICTSSVNMK